MNMYNHGMVISNLIDVILYNSIIFYIIICVNVWNSLVSISLNKYSCLLADHNVYVNNYLQPYKEHGNNCKFRNGPGPVNTLSDWRLLTAESECDPLTSHSAFTFTEDIDRCCANSSTHHYILHILAGWQSTW